MTIVRTDRDNYDVTLHNCIGHQAGPGRKSGAMGMVALTVNRDDPRPLVDQIVAGIKRQIDDRQLRPGARLPSIRRFAAAHDVGRFTVVEAYDRLVAMGYLQSRRGAGFYARSLREEAAATAAPRRASGTRNSSGSFADCSTSTRTQFSSADPGCQTTG